MLDINLSDVTGSTPSPSGPLPEGQYNVAVTGSEVKTTKAGTGQYISVEFTVLSGDYKGRKLWNIFNIKNPNPKAVEIGLQQLKDMLQAANSPLADSKLESVTQLRGLKVKANVKIESSEEYGDKNRINYFDYVDSEVSDGVPNMAPQVSGINDELPF